ncbi:TonB-dependent receptor [Sphingomonas sp. Leaf22]|uniref:TonB-dependent receptor n=1 Tax=Sphingomonas sp. Leaf22 TaxID=1735687 RepID=UPI000A4A3E7B|nr:TonB-dependent receptor [Sphingomonas sp. Leaf22]
MTGYGRDGWRMLAGVAFVLAPAPLLAQDDPEPTSDDRHKDDIVVTGKRPPGSALGEAAPVAVLDAEAIRALGVTSINDLLKLLKPLTTSNSGGEPVFLLNGRRISGYREIQTLPPEALERTEILNEQDSARFGFPATVRIVNFVTKKHFRALTIEQGAGTTTDGGGGTARVELGTTRIEGDRRTLLSIKYDRQNPLFADERPYQIDSDTVFDRTGNLRGLNGGSIDPALDRLAGRAVTATAAPTDPARRDSLSAYTAGTTRATDLSPFLSLRSNDQLKVDMTHAVPIGKTLTGSLNLIVDAQRGFALAGLQGAALRLPAANPASPFGGDVMLYRYLDEAGALTQRNDNLTLHAGSAVQGGIGRWMWTVSGEFDRVRARASVDRGVDPAVLQAAVDAGADPYDLSGRVATAGRIIVRSRTLTNTATAKATANGPLFDLPAGQALLTLNADYATSNSTGRLADNVGAATSLTRTIAGGSASLDLPITSADRGVLDAIGTVSANATLGLTGVSEYGNLTSSNLALRWNPWRPIQITASINTAQTPPAIAALTNPIVTVPNTPFFDFVTGTSTLITVTGGGNIDLAPEERQIRTLGVDWQPIKGRELRLNLAYVDTRIADQLVYPGSATAALQAAFPERFPRDAAGQLLRADLRPINALRERERKITTGWSFFGQLGPKPPAPTPPAKDAPPPPPPRQRPMLWSFTTLTVRLDDRLVLAPGQSQLDLLDGASLDGNSGRPRYELQGNVGGSYGPVRLGTYIFWQAPTRIRSIIAASDLRFTPATFMGLYSQLEGQQLAPKAAWAKGTTFQFEVQNILNDRPDVRDRNGAVPFRFQPSFLDPYGRIVKLSVRKLF